MSRGALSGGEKLLTQVCASILYFHPVDSSLAFLLAYF